MEFKKTAKRIKKGKDIRKVQRAQKQARRRAFA